MNKKSFDALDASTRALADAEVRGWKASEEKNDFYQKALAVATALATLFAILGFGSV